MLASNCNKTYSANAFQRNRYGANKRSNYSARFQMERTNKNVSSRRRYFFEPF